MERAPEILLGWLVIVKLVIYFNLSTFLTDTVQIQKAFTYCAAKSNNSSVVGPIVKRFFFSFQFWLNMSENLPEEKSLATWQFFLRIKFL